MNNPSQFSVVQSQVKSSQVYLKVGPGAAWAGQMRVAGVVMALSSVLTLSSEGNLGPLSPTGSAGMKGENAVMSDRRRL